MPTKQRIDTATDIWSAALEQPVICDRSEDFGAVDMLCHDSEVEQLAPKRMGRGDLLFLLGAIAVSWFALYWVGQLAWLLVRVTL